jgi:hypothetical protein
MMRLLIKAERLAKDDCFVAVEQDAVFAVPFNCASENLTFRITPDRNEVFDCVGVIHACDVLFDDGTFVEVGRDVVRRSTN